MFIALLIHFFNVMLLNGISQWYINIGVDLPDAPVLGQNRQKAIFDSMAMDGIHNR